MLVVRRKPPESSRRWSLITQHDAVAAGTGVGEGAAIGEEHGFAGAQQGGEVIPGGGLAFAGLEQGEHGAGQGGEGCLVELLQPLGGGLTGVEAFIDGAGEVFDLLGSAAELRTSQCRGRGGDL